MYAYENTNMYVCIRPKMISETFKGTCVEAASMSTHEDNSPLNKECLVYEKPARAQVHNFK